MCNLNVESNVIPPMIVHIEHVFNRLNGHNVTHYKIHTDFRFFVCLLDIARALARRHVSSARASRGPSIPNTIAGCIAVRWQAMCVGQVEYVEDHQFFKVTVTSADV